MYLLLACASPPPPRPNVLLLTLDTTRADVIGAYGAKSGATPTLDRLAAEGSRFDRAYTVTPLTIPAHSSIHSGLYPPRHGVRDNGDYFLGPDTLTLAERMGEAGYRTMASVGAEVTSHHWGFAQGFGAYFDDMGPSEGPDRWKVERRGDRVVDDALGWLDAQGEAPWFAWVHLFDAHHPYQPPAPFDAQFAGRPYAGEVAFADAQVGRLRQWLEDRGQLSRTWIFVVADHGEGMGSHGEALHGVLLYDATTRIPFLVRPPQGTAGVVDHPVSLVDLAPTILAVAGAPPLPLSDGLDLRPAMEGGSLPERGVYAESRYGFHHFGWAPLTAWVSAGHKLIDSTTPELYAREDRAERDNLVPSAPEIHRRHAEALAAQVGAMTPSGAADRADLSADRVAQLEALGYLTTAAATEPSAGLPDAVTQLPVLRQLEAARLAQREGDLARARKAIDAVLALDPALTEARLLSATLLAQEGRRDEALAIVQAVDAAHPSSRTRSLMGTMQLGTRPAEAVRLLGEAVAMDPYQVPVWNSYLLALVTSGDPRFAAEADRAVALNPDNPTLQGKQGVAAAMQGRWDVAELLLEGAMAEDPGQPLLSQALAMVHRARGEVLEAESLFEEEIRLFPPALGARRLLVELYVEQGRYADQLVQLEQIRRHEPPRVDSAHSWAQCLFNLRRYPEAEAAVQECRQMAPTYAPCALLEANVLKKLGKEAEAQAAYQEALRLAGK